MVNKAKTTRTTNDPNPLHNIVSKHSDTSMETLVPSIALQQQNVCYFLNRLYICPAMIFCVNNFLLKALFDKKLAMKLVKKKK